MTPPTLARSARGALLGLALGFSLALLCRAAPPRAPAGPVATWVADRNGQRVVGLDPDLFVVADVGLRWPVALAPREDGGAWVVEAAAGGPLGAHALVRLDAIGRVVEGPHPLPPLLDLAPLDGDAALVLTGGDPPQLQRASAGEGLRLLAGFPGAMCVAGEDGAGLVGTADGRLVPIDLERGATGAAVAVGLVIGDLAPGPGGVGWWVLDVGAGGRLVRLDEGLATTWSVDVGFNPQSLGPHAREERVWLASTNEPHAARYGPGGVVELVLPELPLAGLDRSACLDDGGVLLLSHGAVLRFDGGGAALPGQGGFSFLADVARVR